MDNSHDSNEPVGTITVSHHKGLENRDFDYWGSLPDGTYSLYTSLQSSKPLTDEMEKQKNRHLGPHRQSAFRDGWRSAEAAHGIKGDA